MIKFNEDTQKKKVADIQKKEEEEVTQLLAKKYDLPYVNLSDMTIDLDYLNLILEEESRRGKIIVFQGTGNKIQVAVQNPEETLTQNIIKKLQKDYEVQLSLTSLSSLEKTWTRYKDVPEFVELSKGIIDISPKRIEEFLTQALTVEKLKEIFAERVNSKENRRISELLEIILGSAISMEASDIHIEPQEQTVKIRLRIDGVLHDILEFNKQSYQLLLSRIKLVSEMRLNIKTKAQDGRFSIKAKEIEVEIRSSVLPGPYGESVTLRILNPNTISVSLKDLGMQPSLQKIVKKEIIKPNGMILTTGPTGSGKTTTLYAFLREIVSPEIKIITIEEPVEYHLKGITQTQTNPKSKYTFSTGLRSILRQDPDVIMVGEIRDIEAASVALNAALTGHLVLSTLHTNDSAGTIPRLIDLGANPAIIAPAINISLAQRLVRKLCASCKEEYTPTSEEKLLIEKTTQFIPEEIKKVDIANIKIFKAKGCAECNSIGYKGRIGIFEAIVIDDEMEKLILTKPSSLEIRELSKKQKILNIQQDAMFKILDGITSFDEVKRVVGIS